MDLASERDEEEVIWGNVAVNVLLTEELITEKDRKSPAITKVFNRKQEGIATLLKYWASGEGRPENGAFVGFDFSKYKDGSVVLPKYF
jgi:hypothetical protein